MLWNMRVAGKTGTAQNPQGDDHAWFVCFAPVEDPKVAIAVIVEHGGKGGAVAAPIARKILQYVNASSVKKEEIINPQKIEQEIKPEVKQEVIQGTASVVPQMVENSTEKVE